MKCISSGINNRLNLIFLHRQFFVILKMQSIRILSCRRFWLFVELHGIRVMYIYRVGLVDHLINKQSLFMWTVIYSLNSDVFIWNSSRENSMFVMIMFLAIKKGFFLWGWNNIISFRNKNIVKTHERKLLFLKRTIRVSIQQPHCFFQCPLPQKIHLPKTADSIIIDKRCDIQFGQTRPSSPQFQKHQHRQLVHQIRTIY